MVWVKELKADSSASSQNGLNLATKIIHPSNAIICRSTTLKSTPLAECWTQWNSKHVQCIGNGIVNHHFWMRCRTCDATKSICSFIETTEDYMWCMLSIRYRHWIWWPHLPPTVKRSKSISVVQRGHCRDKSFFVGHIISHCCKPEANGSPLQRHTSHRLLPSQCRYAILSISRHFRY